MDNHTDAAPDVDVQAIAHAMLRSIETGEIEAIDKLNAPDMRVWHSFDNAELTWPEAARFLQVMHDNLVLRYDDVRITRLPHGWLQQHTLHLTTREGHVYSMPAALVVTVNNAGLVSRLEEYLDSKPLIQALPFLSAPPEPA